MSDQQNKKPLSTILEQFFDASLKEDLALQEEDKKKALEELFCQWEEEKKNFQTIMQMQQSLTELYKKILIKIK